MNNLKKTILANIIPCPKVINDEWLIKAFDDDLFNCWGLSLYDLNNVTFDIKNKSLLDNVIFNYKDLKLIPFEHKEYNYFLIGNGIEKLHSKGITGKKVNVAIIDYGFKVIHNDLKDCLKEYIPLESEYLVPKDEYHGLVVSGFLCGKKTGIAPEANLYFFENTHNPQYGYLENLKKIYEMNLKGTNIKVVNLSSGYFEENDEIIKYQKLLKNQGCIIIDAHIFEKDFLVINYDQITKTFKLKGWQKECYKDQLLIPTTGGAILSAFKEDEYLIDKSDDFSWYIPVLCGIIALCKQINDNITYEELLDIAKKTSYKVDNYSIINPNGIINYLNK